MSKYYEYEENEYIIRTRKKRPDLLDEVLGTTPKEIRTLEPNEHGNYPCPYCGYILTAIVREWMNPPGIDYFCHRCKIVFKVEVKNSLEAFL